MFRTIPIKAALGLALLAVAAPAAQADYLPHVPVPAGQIQHTVTEITFPASNTFHHDELRNEAWIGASAGRTTTTDVVTGTVTQDCQYTLLLDRCFSADAGHGVITSFPGNVAWLRSWADVGAATEDLLDTPKAHESVTGTTTYLGRPAQILTQTTGKDADGGTGSATIYAEADNDYPLWTEYVSDDPGTATNEPGGPRIISHNDEILATTTLESISPAGVQLTIGAHPGAHVDGATAGTARKKASHKKAAHKKAVHRKHRGYTKK